MEENLKTLDDVKVEAVRKDESLKRDDVINLVDGRAGEMIEKAIERYKTELSNESPLEKYRSETNKGNPGMKTFRSFLKALVYNRNDLLPETMKNFLNETTGSQGGYMVPEEFTNSIYSLVERAGVARRNATVVKMSRKELKLPKLTTLPSFSFMNEGALKPVSNPSFSQVVLTRRDGGFIVIFSKQLLEDEAFDLMSFLSGIAGKIILRNEDTAAFRGLTPIDGLFGTAGTSAVTTSGPAFSSLIYDNLIDATAAVPSETIQNSKWYMNRTVWGTMKKMKYTGSEEYIVSPEDRKSMMLEGFPVELTDGCYAMSESAANRGYIGFGDLSYMIIGERQGLTIDFSKEATVDIGNGSFLNLWQQGLVGLNFGVSFDIQFTFPGALSVIKTASA